jgi:hypothetical protein
MRRLATSMVQFSWAISVFGAQQLVDALVPAAESPGRAGTVQALHAITQSVAQQLNDVTEMIFKTGDVLQHGTLRLMFPRGANEDGTADTPAGVLRESASVLSQGMQALVLRPITLPPGWGYCSRQTSLAQILLPSAARLASLLMIGREGSLAWTEFKNKIQVFELVQHTRSVLNIESETVPPLAELVQRAYNLQPYPTLWGLEGLGKFYADSFWKRNETPDQILSRHKTGDLPAGSLPMLHAGIGLSFASRLFGSLPNESQPSPIEEALRQFLSLCRQNSRPGYQGAAIESLGLVLRELYPALVLPVDRLLWSIDEEMIAYFWHGVGRAIYFSPANFLPSSNASWRALKMCEEEAPHAIGRMNCRAGLAWAVTLVNFRQPEILESLLQVHSQTLAEDESFAYGIGGALILRYDTTPEDPSLSSFCGHRVNTQPALTERWRKQVSWSCETALHRIYPRLKARHEMQEIFRYKPVSDRHNLSMKEA